MCGIAGVLLAPRRRSPAVWNAISATFTQNLVFNEERGRDASGIALIQTDGSIDYFKAPLPASTLTETADYHRVLAGMNAETVVLLGHTRFPTKGSPLNNANNHPVLVDDVVGIHNGHIDNDMDLTADFRLSRTAQVDSEVIFRLIARVDPALTPDNYIDTLKEALAPLDGKFTFLAVDRRHPNKLVVAKRGNPLSLHYHKPWQALFFSSRYLFLRQTFGQAVLSENIPSEHLFLFDAEHLGEFNARPCNRRPL